MRHIKKQNSKIFSPDGFRKNVVPGPAVAPDVPDSLYALVQLISTEIRLQWYRRLIMPNVRYNQTQKRQILTSRQRPFPDI